MKKAICVGINNYPGTANDLQGCVNDANDWADLLASYGFETSKILDDHATKGNILNSLQGLVSSAVAGDVVVFTYSGHGTQIMDTSGDEADGYDEAIYVYDGPIIDDELRTILNTANKDAEIIVIMDSCFSGTVTRAKLGETAKPRYYKTDAIPATAVLKKKFLTKVTEEDLVEILLTGCTDKEYSYDANINGKWNGAMTAYAISVIAPELTYNEYYAKLRTILPSSEYPQTPQLEGSTENKKRVIFTEKTSSDSGDSGTGGDTGTTGSSGCLGSLLSIMAVAAAVAILVSMIF